MDWAKTIARRDEKHLSFGILCVCVILDVWRYISAGMNMDMVLVAEFRKTCNIRRTNS